MLTSSSWKQEEVVAQVKKKGLLSMKTKFVQYKSDSEESFVTVSEHTLSKEDCSSSSEKVKSSHPSGNSDDDYETFSEESLEDDDHVPISHKLLKLEKEAKQLGTNKKLNSAGISKAAPKKYLSGTSGANVVDDPGKHKNEKKKQAKVDSDESLVSSDEESIE